MMLVEFIGPQLRVFGNRRDARLLWFQPSENVKKLLCIYFLAKMWEIEN